MRANRNSTPANLRPARARPSPSYLRVRGVRGERTEAREEGGRRADAPLKTRTPQREVGENENVVVVPL